MASVAELERAELERAVAQLERAAELERERAERAAMHAAGLESRMAERMFLFDARLPAFGAPVTYEHMYTLRHNALLDAHELLGRVRRLLHDERLLPPQRLSRAVAILDAEMSSDDEPEASEEESMDDDPVVESIVQSMDDDPVVDAESIVQSVAESLVSPPEWQPFSGRSYRLN